MQTFASLLVAVVVAVTPVGVTQSVTPIAIPTNTVQVTDAGLTIEGAQQVQVGTFLKLKVIGVAEDVSALVAIDPLPAPDSYEVRDLGKSIYITSKKPTKYLITVAVSGSTPREAPKGFSRCYEFIGGLEPDSPTPGPVTPAPVTPTAVPDDRFGNLGKAVFAAANGIPVADRETSAVLYADVAKKLEDGGYAGAYAAQKDLQSKRAWNDAKWAPVFQVVSNAWNKHFEAMNVQDVIDFQRAVAAGLRGK